MSSNEPGNQNTVAGAITYPNRDNESLQPMSSQPRQPRSLQGLLRFAMEATKAEDAPGNSELGPMDDERRKFLEEALKSLTVNLAQVLQKSIKTLTDKEKIHSIQLGQTVPEDVEVAFTNLLEYIDDIDVTNDFYKMGGFAIFPICYGSENDEVRASASSILAELCQNNPFCQARALECGLLNVLLNLVESEKGNALSKCLYALSCASRGHEPSCRELVNQGGCASLSRLVGNEEASVRTKAAFLVCHLAQNHPDAKAQFIEHNLVRTIAERLRKGRDRTSEHLLGTLLTLTEGLDSTVLRQCRDPQLQLKGTLEKHLRHPDLVGDTFIEEKEYCQELLKLLVDCQPKDQASCDGADR